MITRKRVRLSQAGQSQQRATVFGPGVLRRFPDDDACLEHVMEVRYGLRHSRQVRHGCDLPQLAGRPAYSCAHCGDHVYPCAGTIFQDSRTPLQSWFYAIYLFIVTRHGVSGKELQRSSA